MKNKEKYAKEIVEIAITGHSSFAVNKITGEPETCSKLNCSNCAFNMTGKTCNVLCREWAESEYKEPITVERLDNEFNKLCKGTSCGSCKYSDAHNCNFTWLLEHYNVTEKGASE